MTYEQLSPDRRPEADRIRKIVMDAERGLGKAAMSDRLGSAPTNETEQYVDTTQFETIPRAS
jgi:hypothetical protein